MLIEDISELEDKTAEIEAMTNAMIMHSFDFEKEQLFKCKLIKYEKDKYRFLFVIDHMIYDAHSTRIIEEELFAIYKAYNEMMPNPLSALRLQLKDYVWFHNQHYKGDKLSYHQQYFKKLFEHVPDKLAIQPGILYGKEDLSSLLNGVEYSAVPKNSKGNGYVFMVSQNILDPVHVLCAELEISFFSFILASYCVFLNRISCQSDFCINTPMSTRNREEYSKIVGWLTGELFLRVKLNEETSFKEFLYTCRDVIVEAIDHVYYQDVVNLLGVEWDRLVTAQLNLVNDVNTAAKKIDAFKPFHYVAGHVSTGINFNVHIHENGMLVNCTYKTGIIDQSEISCVCQQFVNVMKWVVDSLDISIKNESVE